MEETHNLLSDGELLRLSLQGDKQSLGQLVERYNDLIYNLCFKMLSNKEDAADMTQEVLVKLITRLEGFREESSFKTWVYRITVNHILNYRKSAAVKQRSTFRQFGETLDGAPDSDIADVANIPADDHYGADKTLLVEETKQTCMSGMLLCLDKRHRMVFILGELFGLNDKMGGQVMDVTPENFRMILSRAKRDLYNFMQDKCGLVNSANPCRCAKKTKAFIEAGFVDPRKLRFAGSHLRKIASVAEEKQRDLDNLLDNEYRQLYQSHTYMQAPDFVEALNKLLASDKISRIFNLKK
jgi:RNA polymerase sigma factor (sigma-70 family)